jgi:hypothetical protein
VIGDESVAAQSGGYFRTGPDQRQWLSVIPIFGLACRRIADYERLTVAPVLIWSPTHARTPAGTAARSEMVGGGP